MLRLTLIIMIVATLDTYCRAQTQDKAAAPKIWVNRSNQAVKSSPAYAEILLRKTEREAQLEEFLLDYTDEFPKVKEIRFELELLQKQLDKVSTVNAADAPKLSLALGKLMVRKSEIEVELWNLRNQYNADHPEVKRTQRKINVYEKAIKEILP